MTPVARYGTIDRVVHIPPWEPRVRYAVISDIHSNLAALRAVLGSIGSVDAVWCLGDVIGYGPDPNECVDLVRQCAAACLAGNHDLATIGHLDLGAFNADAAKAIDWTGRQLTSNSVAYLAGQPSLKQLEHVTLAHASPRDPVWEYVLSVSAAQENFPHFETACCLVGHTHRPAIYQQTEGGVRQIAVPDGQPVSIASGRFIINPGSVGQPRDGDPRASYLILDATAATVRFNAY